MKKTIRVLTSFMVSTLIFVLTGTSAIGQINPEDCYNTKYNGEGYSTSITSVVDNEDGSYTIILTVEHDGCSGPDCQGLSHYSIEAAPTTYSNIEVNVLEGNMTYGSIVMGPNLGGDPFQGFKISNTSGIGNGLAGVFTITYTLSGDLQSQQAMAKAGDDQNIVSFSQQEFQEVISCLNRFIIPYYPPPDGGKLYNSVISAELESLYITYQEYGYLISNDIFQIIDETNVLIEIVAQDATSYNALLSLLAGTEYGMTQIEGNPDEFRITGVYPVINLLKLNDLPDLISFAQPAFPGIPQVGLVDSEGDMVIKSYFGRNGFNLSGAGIKIGAMSDSYNTKEGNIAADDVLRKDLPGVTNTDYPTLVHVVGEYPYGTATDEGRAMLQIIHDVAPGAELAFRTGMISPVDFALGIHELAEVAECDVIVDDITYISEPFFRDGIVAQAVNAVVASGITYVTAAGNFGKSSYQSDFFPVDAPDGLSGYAHNFAGAGGNDMYQNISVEPGSYTIVLQWDDGSGLAETDCDLDIYLADEYGSVLFGFNRENIGGDAIEVLPFTAIEAAETNIMIVNANGPNPDRIKYIVFRGDVTFNEYNPDGSPTIFGQANSEGAITVGASYYANTTAYGADENLLNYYSSVGGTEIDGVIRNKPDVTGPDGVNTSVELYGPNLDGDAFPNFFGTSASAPHIAGVAALLLEAKAKFYDGPAGVITPQEIKDLLKSTAEDMEAVGYDLESGAGMVQADEALLTLANPSPYITSFTWDETLTPGSELIPISVIGDYLTDGSEIYFNGTAISGSTLSGDNIINGTIPLFDERYPKIQVFNPSKSGTNGLDGGLSNPLYFNTKPTIVIEIDDESKIYGEVIPVFTANYFVETTDGMISLTDAGLSQTEIDRIHDIPLITVADDLSNVGTWGIYTSDNDPLSPTSSLPVTDPLDISILDNFDIDVESSLLTIEKMDLMITPQDLTITYGTELETLEYDYVYNNDLINPENNVIIDPATNATMLNAMKLAHATALVNVVGTVKATALVNELGEPLLDEDMLDNTSFFISNAASVRNATALVNGTLLDPQQILNAITFQSTSATALVNAIAYTKATALVNGLSQVFMTGNTTATALVNTLGNLVNAAFTAGTSATALVNAENVNTSSNTSSVVLLDETDVLILSGSGSGSIQIHSISIIMDNEVGEHIIVPGAFTSNNYNLSYGLGTITIVPATAELSIDVASLSPTYDGSGKSVSVSTTPDYLLYDITYDGSSTLPLNAGDYLVEVTINDNNYIGTTSETMSILPATANVTAETEMIYAGDPLPTFTPIYSGFVNGEDESVVSSLTFSLDPVYAGSAGVYGIIPAPIADNYVFVVDPGTLYVNPFGSGTKHIKTQLQCIEEITDPGSNNGFLYIAHFSYENDNATVVYIPIGDDNYFTAEGFYFTNSQPEAFLPGGGSFTASFDGNKLTWTVASFRHNGHKTSTASQASANSSNCNKSEEVTDDLNDVSLDTKAYPNPVSGLLYLDLDQASISENDVNVYDLFGRKYNLDIERNSAHQLQINFGSLRSGVYFVRVRTIDSFEVIRVLKL